MIPLCQTWTLEERKQRVHDLVERFTKEKSFYTSKSFKEAETRLNFIDPFLECLGWDVKNEEGKTESFKNVKVETNQIQGQNVKHPDYALRLGMGQTVLYVEAKQPSINLKDDPEPALQVRRYGYTSKLNLSLLTDFEELSVYDTTIKPKPTDKVGIARIKYYTYDKYEEKFEDIYNTYSYEACNSGKMTFFAESSSNKKGTASIDDDILQMIEEWRLLLANDIALNNQTIDEYDLTGAVQKIIDRIIFLRICEDKSVEEYGMLKNILGQPCHAEQNDRHAEQTNCHAELVSASHNKEIPKQVRNDNTSKVHGDNTLQNSYTGENLSPVYSHLKSIFNQANDKYNAGLFAKDDYIDSITVSDKTLTKMIKSLYYPECQYEWSVLPVEILGTIYERFLGKIIQFSRKTKNGHNITVIEKPEVQKAGGVYYTPRYIVQYIVEQTIGAKIKDKTPEQISKMRFVDPACGSGSFLVGAYDYLLRFHLDYYTNSRHAEQNNRHAEQMNCHAELVSASHNKEIPKQVRNDNTSKVRNDILTKSEKNGIIYKDAQTGEYKLSIAEKRRILVNNIYGVDLDLQATEVSKVSLFLKLLENEGRSLNTQGQGEMFKTSDLAQEKILPFMGNNIKCGNSLVGTDFVNPGLFESKEEFVKVRPFDWEKEFSQIRHAEQNDCHAELVSASHNKEIPKQVRNDNTSKVYGDNTSKVRNDNTSKVHGDNTSKVRNDNTFKVRNDNKGHNLFDCVIGNPPYVKEYTSREAFLPIKESKLGKYYQGKMDLWYFFVCFGLDLLKDDGLLGFIAPSNWRTNAGASIMRNKILSDSKILDYVDFGDYKVFAEAGIQTMTFVLEKSENPKPYKLNLSYVDNKNIPENELKYYLQTKTKHQDISELTVTLDREKLKDNTISFADDGLNDLLTTIQLNGGGRFEATDLAQGIVFPQDFLNKKGQEVLPQFKVGDSIFGLKNEDLKRMRLSKEEQNLIKPYFTSEQIGRYYTSPQNTLWMIYTDSSFKKASTMKPYPKLKAHLDKFQDVITSDNKPYGLHRARDEKFFKGEKVIVQRKCPEKPIFSYANFDTYITQTYYSIQTDKWNLKYLTGLLNSKLIEFWLRHKGKMQGDNFQVDKEPLMQIPICNASPDTQQNLATLVDQMLQTQAKLNGETLKQVQGDASCAKPLSPSDKQFLEQKATMLDAQINTEVYKLYGLTKEEIAVVEGR